MQARQRPHPGSAHRFRLITAASALLAVLFMPGVQAIEEADASTVWLAQEGTNGVVAAGHLPTTVSEGEQFQGFIHFTAEVNATDVRYQICRVGEACFAPPTPATKMGDGNWTFDTNDYRDPVFGEPVHYKAGWRVGVQYLLNVDGHNVTFPEGLSHEHPLAREDPVAWAETHYLAFNVASDAPTAPVPGPGPVMLIPGAAAAFMLMQMSKRRRG